MPYRVIKPQWSHLSTLFQQDSLEMMLVVCDTLQVDLHVKENYLTASAMKQREFSFPIVLMLVYY